MADVKSATDEIAPVEATPAAAGPSGGRPASPEAAAAKDVAMEELAVDEDEGVNGRSNMRIYSILTALYLALAIAALDQTIVATTIPTITASLHSAAGYVWIGGAYLLANAAAGTIWTRLSDIWGRKIILLVTIGVFAVASIIAALSVNMPMLIAARALQGVAAGGLMPMVTITISDLFSVRKRALYLSLLGLMWAVAGSAGPLVGGALTQLASWRWCFWLSVPVCAVSFVLVFFFLDVHNPRTPLAEGLQALDWWGTVSILAVSLLLLLGLDFGGAAFPWSSPKVVCLIVFGGVLVFVFLYCEKRLARFPLIPLGLFGQRSNVAIIVLGFCHSMAFIGAEFYLPLYFQSAKEASPLRSGVLIVPMMAVEAAADVVTGVIIHRTGRYREIIWFGATTMTLGIGLFMLLGPDTSLGRIVAFEIVSALGVATLFQAPTVAIHNTVAQSETAATTSTVSFLRNIGTSLSIVLGGVVFQNSMNGQQGKLALAGLSAEVRSALAGKDAAANVEIIKKITDETQRRVVKEAYSDSIRNIFLLLTVVSSVAFLASLFIQQKTLKTEHVETKTGLAHMRERGRQDGDQE